VKLAQKGLAMIPGVGPLLAQLEPLMLIEDVAAATHPAEHL